MSKVKFDIDMTPAATARKKIDFDKYLIDLSKDEKEPQPLISITNVPIFTRGNISCISGKAKSRKTYLVALLSSQFLENSIKEKIIIFDTEQGGFYVQKAVKRIHRLLDWKENENNERLRVFKLRELGTEQRREFVENAIKYYNPDLVFVDGLRDLIKSINDEAEATDMINSIMKISSENNCHISVILHENKVETSVRGWIGSEVVNKSETTISVEKDGNLSAVSPKFCKNIPFDIFYFKINDDGLPEYCEQELNIKNDSKLRNLFNDLLPAVSYLSYDILKNKIIEKTSKSEPTAKRYISEATKEGIIVKNEIGYYYSFENNLKNEDETLPF